MAQNTDEFYAETYDESVPDWPGEMDFYRALAADARARRQAVLELACGTGRVAIRLAQEGGRVVGLDLSEPMIAVVTQKSAGLDNTRWVLGDMREFALGETFGLVIIPGHAFQNLNTGREQAACLGCAWRHLEPGGVLAVHLDHMGRENMRWLGDLCGELGGVFEPDELFRHPKTGRQVQTSRAWSYEPATQSATVRTIWEELDDDGRVVDKIEREPVRLHVVFRLEMEHLLARAGFNDVVVYGDFNRQPLGDDSESMVWVARRP